MRNKFNINGICKNILLKKIFKVLVKKHTCLAIAYHIYYYFFSGLRRLRYHNMVLYNCMAQKLYMPFVIQIPFWVCTSMALRNLSSMQHISEHSFGEPVIEANMRFLQMSNEGNIIFIQRATVMLLVV